VRALGVIDLPTMKEKLNLHYSLSLDLFGSGSLDQRGECLQCRHQGRFRDKIEDDHRRKRDLSGAQARRRRDQAGG
jgi:benzoyl-CoA 2,3-dioxygenase component B